MIDYNKLHYIDRLKVLKNATKRLDDEFIKNEKLFNIMLNAIDDNTSIRILDVTTNKLGELINNSKQLRYKLLMIKQEIIQIKKELLN